MKRWKLNSLSSFVWIFSIEQQLNSNYFPSIFILKQSDTVASVFFDNGDKIRRT